MTLATEAVLHSLKSSRNVYSIIVGRLLVALMRKEQQLKDQEQEEEAASDEVTVVLQSILLKVLRAYHGAEAGYLSQGDAGKVVRGYICMLSSYLCILNICYTDDDLNICIYLICFIFSLLFSVFYSTNFIDNILP